MYEVGSSFAVDTSGCPDRRRNINNVIVNVISLCCHYPTYNGLCEFFHTHHQAGVPWDNGRFIFCSRYIWLPRGRKHINNTIVNVISFNFAINQYIMNCVSSSIPTTKLLFHGMVSDLTREKITSLHVYYITLHY